MNATKKCMGWLAGFLFGGIMAMTVAGCATQSAPATGSEESEIITSCCSSGTFTCSTNPNIEVDYDPPGCGAWTRLQAQALCNAKCGHACHDSGWINYCQ